MRSSNVVLPSFERLLRVDDLHARIAEELHLFAAGEFAVGRLGILVAVQADDFLPGHAGDAAFGVARFDLARPICAGHFDEIAELLLRKGFALAAHLNRQDDFPFPIDDYAGFLFFIAGMPEDQQDLDVGRMFDRRLVAAITVFERAQHETVQTGRRRVEVPLDRLAQAAELERRG